MYIVVSKNISKYTNKLSVEGNFSFSFVFFAEASVGPVRRKQAGSGTRTRINLKTGILVSRARAFLISGDQTPISPCGGASNSPLVSKHAQRKQTPLPVVTNLAVLPRGPNSCCWFADQKNHCHYQISALVWPLTCYANYRKKYR